jgi:hypothetical protein
MNISYLTNFKPHHKISDDFSFEINNKQHAIFCKNFLIFLLLMKYIFSESNNNISLFVKPQQKTLQTILRPPYRHKISRHQITVHRYYIACVFKFNLSRNLEISNLNQIYFFLNKVKKYYIFFETNICYMHRSKIKFNFHFNNFFNL